MSLNQMQFPGMGRNLPSFSVQGTNPKHESVEYTSAHAYPVPENILGRRKQHPFATAWEDWEPNRFPESTRGLDGDMGLSGYGPEREEFVPTERIRSDQLKVNPKAVQHQVQNANPLALHDDPYMASYTEPDGEAFKVMDGNHRANAAAVRGQLFIPARVRRPIDPNQDVRTLH